MKINEKAEEEVKIYETIKEACAVKHDKMRKFYETVDMKKVMALLNE